MVTSKIQIKNHLAEYIKGKFGDCRNAPVRLPDRMDLYHTIWDLTEKRPVNAPIDTGNLEIILPERAEGKDPSTYNYIGIRSARILERKIENLFLAEIHDTLLEDKQRYGIPYIESIHLFLRKYAIDSISEETIWKDFYRWKARIRNREKRGYKKFTDKV